MTRVPSDDDCTSCDGSGKWPEFLPEDVDCMGCGGTGRRDRVPSEAIYDEFADDDDGEFPTAFVEDTVELYGEDTLVLETLTLGDRADA